MEEQSNLGPQQPGQRRLRVWLMLFAVVTLSIYIVRFAFQVQPGVTHDDAEYLVLAESFAMGQPYRLINYPDAPLETTWPPGYPLLVLTAPWLLFGPDYTLLRAINVVLAAAAGFAGYWLLRHFVSRTAAMLMAGLFILNPQVINWATIAMSDIPFTCLIALFWLMYLRWKAQVPRGWRWYGLAVITLGAATLMRYWGVAFLAAAGLDSILDRRWCNTMLLVVGVGLLVLPFPIFLATQPEIASSSFYAVRSLGRTVPEYLANIGVSLVTYWRTIPVLLVPVLGPSITAILNSVGLAWLVDVIHTLLLLVIIRGAWQVTKRSRLPALIVLCYMALLIPLTEHLGTDTIVFDEPRYLVPILLLLYLFLLEGVTNVAARWFTQERRKRLLRAAGVALVLILVGRNVQQAIAQQSFPLVRLDSGQEWIQTNTQPGDVFMTSDPVIRYIHIRRRTLDYPASAGEFWNDLTRYDVAYLMMARSLNAIQSSWSIFKGMQPNAQVEAAIKPILDRQPQCFSLVYSDPQLSTEIYQVSVVCKQHHPE